MDSQLSENKLILLYLIREKDNITSAEMTDFVLFRGYMDYFSMAGYLTELIESKLVLELSRDEHFYYTLHPRGIEVVEMFRARIPHSIREEIRSYAQNAFLHGSPLMEALVRTEEESGGVRVNCQVKDYDRVVMELSLKAESDEEAAVMRDNWYKKGMRIYWNLLRDIGGKKNEDILPRDAETGGNDADTSAPRNV